MGETLVVGKVIKMPCMRRGLCGYQSETVLVSQDALKRMAETIHGIPVVIDHQIIDTNNVEQLTVGRVADMHYDAEDDNWYAHFVVENSDAVAKLQSGWGVSTAYRIIQAGPGGTLNNVPFNREVLDAAYDHLAIVQSPRYEMARNPIFYNSTDEKPLKGDEVSSNINDSLQKKGIAMLGKFWRKVREEIKLNSGDELFVTVGDKEMPLNDVVAAVHAYEVKMNSKKIVMNGEDMVEYNGTSMTVNELVSKYNEAKAFEGKETAEEEKKEEEAKKENEEEKKPESEEKKENEEGAEAKKDEEKKENEAKEKEEDIKVNSNFAELKEIHANAGSQVQPTFLTLQDRLELGKKLFG